MESHLQDTQKTLKRDETQRPTNVIDYRVHARTFSGTVLEWVRWLAWALGLGLAWHVRVGHRLRASGPLAPPLQSAASGSAGCATCCRSALRGSRG